MNFQSQTYEVPVKLLALELAVQLISNTYTPGNTSSFNLTSTIEAANTFEEFLTGKTEVKHLGE